MNELALFIGISSTVIQAAVAIRSAVKGPTWRMLLCSVGAAVPLTVMIHFGII